LSKKANSGSIYTFIGSAGQQLFYDALTSAANSSFRFKLIDPAGEMVFDTDAKADFDPNNGLVLKANGLYQVVIDGAGESTGNYQFQLLNRADAQEINLDEDITGQLQFTNSSTGYRFSLNSDRYIYFNAQAGSGGNQWLLYGGDGKLIVERGMTADYEVKLGAGEYYLVMQGNNLADKNYKMRLVTPEFTTTPLTLNTLVTGNISEAGEQDTYTFSGTAGQQLTLDTITGTGNATVRIYDQYGEAIFNSTLSFQSDALILLKETGNYKVVIDGYDSITEPYSFRLLDARTSAISINLDTDIIGQLSTGQETQFYQFTGTQSQNIYVD
jgi:large repetitive protein